LPITFETQTSESQSSALKMRIFAYIFKERNKKLPLGWEPGHDDVIPQTLNLSQLGLPLTKVQI